MASLNKCIFIGNVTKDVDSKFLPNGDAVVSLSIACNESYKDKKGNKQEKVEYINVVAYRKLAEIISRYVTKGSPIYIEGRMQTRKWQTKEGQDRYTTEIVADNMQMLGSNKGESQQKEQKSPAVQQQTKSDFDAFDDDDLDSLIPF